MTEHQAAIYACAHCRGETRAAGVSALAQYGERLRAAAVYLNVQHLIPEDRVAQTLSDLFGAVRFCPDTLVDRVKRKAYPSPQRLNYWLGVTIFPEFPSRAGRAAPRRQRPVIAVDVQHA